MRVGILTFPHTTNYGAALQGYALRQQIAALGHDCGVLDYRHPVAMRVYRGLSKNRHFHRIYLRKRRFVAFERETFNLIGPPGHDVDTLARTAAGLDAVVVGSDQVWDVTGFRGWRPEMYLGFAGPGCRRVAYAPSCGMTAELGENTGFVSEALSGFDHLSARDANTACFVESATGSRPPLVLDPTFLGDFGSATGPGRPVEAGYLLVYAQLPPACAAAVRDAASRLGLGIVSVGYAFRGASREMIGAGPREFLSAYRGASYVVTSFFHGTIFAILNRTPFVSFLKPDKTIKVSDLLGRLGLSDRMLEIRGGGCEIPDRLLGLDYSAVEGMIEHEVSASRAFLEGAFREGDA